MSKLRVLSQENFPVLDKALFEKLFKEHFKDMVFYAQKYVKDLDSAREIAQEAFIALWERREQIDVSKTVKSYLGSIVHNRSLNYLRENKKFDRNLLAVEHLSDRFVEISDRMSAEETETKIYAAIDELPEKCREIFKMSRFEHLKYQEIADKLGISVKTVEAQMSKALQHMKARLAEYLMLLLILWISGMN